MVERLTAKLVGQGSGKNRPGWPLPWHCQRRNRDDFTSIPAPFRSEDERHVIPLFGLYNYVFKKQPTAEIVKIPEQSLRPESPSSIMDTPSEPAKKPFELHVATSTMTSTTRKNVALLCFIFITIIFVSFSFSQKQKHEHLESLL